MKLEHIPFGTIDWSTIPSRTFPGETGTAQWRTVESGNVRIRIVDYSPGYKADHWCQKGHVVLVLNGELTTELEDGRTFVLTKGQSYRVADGAEPHRSSTAGGASLFIVD